MISRRGFIKGLGAAATVVGLGKCDNELELRQSKIGGSALTAAEVRGVVAGPARIDVAELTAVLGEPPFSSFMARDFRKKYGI